VTATARRERHSTRRDIEPAWTTPQAVRRRSRPPRIRESGDNARRLRMNCVRMSAAEAALEPHNQSKTVAAMAIRPIAL
jgi:hypothetical protein